jgi:hypothetical protein
VALYGPKKMPGVEGATAEPEGPVDQGQQNLLAEVALLQDLLRGAVRSCVEDASLRAIFANAEAIRERWQVPSTSPAPRPDRVDPWGSDLAS